MAIKKIMAIPDIQAPKHDPIAVKTAIKIVDGEEPDYLIHIGDLVDFQSISRFPKRSWEEASLTADQEIDAANQILDQFDKVTPQKTKVIYLEGNHDRRLELFMIQWASKLGRGYRGATLEYQLNLEGRKYLYVRTNQQPYHIGKAGFIHGWFCNIHHAKKTMERGGQNLIYGHTHDFQVSTGPHLEQEAPRLAMSIGCLCDFRQVYLESRPMNWIHGVAIIYSDDKTGRFWPTFHPIINGESIISGVRYKA